MQKQHHPRSWRSDYTCLTPELHHDNVRPIHIGFKCYLWEDHLTKRCKSTTQICPECADIGHTFEQFTNTFKRYITCSNNRRTLAAGCPIRSYCQQRKTRNTTTRRQTTANLLKHHQEDYPISATYTDLYTKKSNHPQQQCTDNAYSTHHRSSHCKLSRKRIILKHILQMTQIELQH